MHRDYIVLQVEGIPIVGQIFLPDESRKVIVCLCHGAPSGDPPQPGDGGYPELAERFCREGYGTFFFNFRGAGDSGGNIDFLGWTRDLAAVVAYLSGLKGWGRLYMVGFSAGAAASIYVAARDQRVSGVAACACPANFGLFNSAEPGSIIERYRAIGAIRDEGFPPSLKAWFEGLRQVTPANHVAGIAPRPLLLVHGSQDATVPPGHARELYEKAGEPKKIVIIEGAGHRLRRDERVIGAIMKWLDSVRMSGGPAPH
jgi:alpha-beta hydrolase superfamily lysophospholipase